MKIGIRKETQYPSEKRAALTPDHVTELTKRGVSVYVEPTENQRIFGNEEYVNAGAVISEDLSECDVIFGVKEVPVKDLIPNKPFVFFSHTIKGQKYNMPLLKSILNKNITLMDYELVKDEKGFRIIFFGKFAGYAGMIDSLWLLGKRLSIEGIENPFSIMTQATEYNLLSDARNSIEKVGEEIKKNGLPEVLVPFITAFTGYGNVSKGAQDLYDLLPVEEIKPKELEDFIKNGNFSKHKVYKVEFREEDMYLERNGNMFELENFMQSPENYSSTINQYLPYFSIFINGIYWESRFPRHITKKMMKELYESGKTQKLKVIGDITCDIEGSVELTVKATSSNNPSYVFEPLNDKIIDGISGNGPVILAVDKLPAELPREASKFFGDLLLPFVAKLSGADYSVGYDELNIPREFKDAIIAHKGELTPNYKYLENYL